jgi:hypothetical protein
MNATDLELYAVMGEHDNVGIPLAYCLFSTATSITPGKRKIALTSFFGSLRDKYNVHPRFVHTDKDIAEIKGAQAVWTGAKHQLCWWHLKKAVKARLEKSKLSTSVYHPHLAKAEFDFIDINFIPSGKADPLETEDPEAVVEVHSTPHPNALPIKLKIPAGLSLPSRPPPADIPSDDEETEGGSRCTFCAKLYHKPIIAMIECHLCTHPLIPGYSSPTKEGVCAWAVKEIYTFCVKYDLRECWAYLWENWYCPARWRLWARSDCPEIPVLKTTMICESQ